MFQLLYLLLKHP